MLDPGVRMRQEVRLLIGSPQELVGHGARRYEFSHASGRTTAHDQQHEPVCAATQQRAPVVKFRAWTRGGFHAGQAATAASRRAERPRRAREGHDLLMSDRGWL